MNSRIEKEEKDHDLNTTFFPGHLLVAWIEKAGVTDPDGLESGSRTTQVPRSSRHAFFQRLIPVSRVPGQPSGLQSLYYRTANRNPWYIERGEPVGAHQCDDRGWLTSGLGAVYVQANGGLRLDRGRRVTASGSYVQVLVTWITKTESAVTG